MQINEPLLDIENIKNSKKNLLDLFIRRTAVLTSTPEHLCEKIIKDQWANASKVLQSTSDVSEIDFCNLGTLFMSQAKAKKRIARLQNSNNKYLVEAEQKPELQKKLLNKVQINKGFIKSITYKLTKQKQEADEC